MTLSVENINEDTLLIVYVDLDGDICQYRNDDIDFEIKDIKEGTVIHIIDETYEFTKDCGIGAIDKTKCKYFISSPNSLYIIAATDILVEVD